MPGDTVTVREYETRANASKEIRVRYLRMGLVAAAACMALPTAAGALVMRLPNGHPISLMQRHNKGGPGGSTSGGAVLTSHGGPVLKSEAPYVIFWTPAGHPIASSSETLMKQYLTDVAAASTAGSTTNVFSVLGQYGVPYSQTFNSATQAVSVADPYPTKQKGCKVATGLTACVTDASLQAEIAKLIDAGTLPQPGAPGTGTTPVYLMVTPVDVNVCTSGGACANTSFCAYHDYFSHNGASVLYASVPFAVFATSPKGCQTDQYSIYETPVGSGGDEAYNVADDMSHELSEMITDPLINAWYSTGGLEVADLCEAYAATANTSKGLSPLAYAPAFGNAASGVLYDQVVNGDEYYNQTEFSNSANHCLTGTTPLPPT